MRLPRQEYWSGCHFLLQGIFLTQGLNLSLLLCRQILYHWATWEAPREDIQMVNKQWRCSTSIAIREKQIKITMLYHFTLAWIAIIKNKAEWNSVGHSCPTGLVLSTSLPGQCTAGEGQWGWASTHLKAPAPARVDGTAPLKCQWVERSKDSSLPPSLLINLWFSPRGP